MTLPPDLPDRIRAWNEGRLEVVAPRLASTVALIRDDASGLEVYLLRRVRGMSFAAGMHVFPGGSVDPADGLGAGGAASWVGPTADWWAKQFGIAPAQARALVAAAVRETFEEAGVLLASPLDPAAGVDLGGPGWEADRTALEARQHSLADLLHRRGLALRADLLAPLAHWITPEVEPRRFDTFFFLADLPAGQAARTAGTEADHRLWIRPADALAEHLRLMPPTMAVLHDLARFDTVAQALAAARDLHPIQPRPELDGTQVRFVV